MRIILHNQLRKKIKMYMMIVKFITYIVVTLDTRIFCILFNDKNLVYYYLC